MQCKVVHISGTSEDDVIFQHNASWGHSRWVNPLIISNDSRGANDSVDDEGGEVNAATPRDPDSCGIHWEEPDFFRFICRYEHTTVTTSAGKKHTLLQWEIKWK